MTITLPAAIRRTGSRRDDGPAERLTFKREEAAQLESIDEGAVVTLPNGESFTVLDMSTDMTGRPQLVVRSQPVRSPIHDEREPTMTAALTEQPEAQTLATVPVEIESSNVAPVPGPGGMGKFGKVTYEAYLAPEPDAVVSVSHRAAPAEALVYGHDSEALRTLDALFDEHAKAHHAAANVLGAELPLAPLLVNPARPERALHVVARQPSPDQRRMLYVCRPAGADIGDEIARREQRARNRDYAAKVREWNNAETKLRADGYRHEETRKAIETLTRLKATHPSEYTAAMSGLSTEEN